jgi:dGTPase
MNTATTWEKLMTGKRLRKNVEEKPETRTVYQQDFDRIIFSSAFRRLQDKTQVFPLAESDYVRTRLTHSLEVSSVARSLGTIVGKELISRHGLRDRFSALDFGAVVAAAAIAHDIGNPPFGHSGEAAIQHWFANSEVARQALSGVDNDRKPDFFRFEGNAQGFRVLTRLQSPDNDGGLQLTSAVLGAFTKYPCSSSVHSCPSGGRPVSQKKHGFFWSERPFIEEVAQSTGLRRNASGTGWYRHPLAFLVEAADDICYRIVDFEDGFRLGYVDFKTAKNLLLPLVAGHSTEQRLASIGGNKEKIEYLRAKAINSLIDTVAQIFLDNEPAIISGDFDRELLSEASGAHSALNEIKERSKDDVYSARPVLEIEAAGFDVLGGMLQMFVDAVDKVANGSGDAKSNKLLNLLPPQVTSPSGRPDGDPYVRLIRVTDFVCGMTDGYAVSMFKKLRGISLPHS